jgi:hypothetical protein
MRARSQVQPNPAISEGAWALGLSRYSISMDANTPIKSQLFFGQNRVRHFIVRKFQT